MQILRKIFKGGMYEMKKRILALILAIIMVFSVIPEPFTGKTIANASEVESSSDDNSLLQNEASLNDFEVETQSDEETLSQVGEIKGELEQEQDSIAQSSEKEEAIETRSNAEDTTMVNLPLQYGQTEARSILNMINEMRTSSTDAWYWNSDDTTKTICNDLSELAYDYDLERIAMQRAAEIAMSYSHTRPDGTSCFTAYDIPYLVVGENIAAGYTSAVGVNKGWREDDETYGGQGHRRNMLSNEFNCVGIGHAYYNGVHYWVEEFAYRDSISTTATTANDNEQTVAVNVLQSKITDLDINMTLNQDIYSLQVNETLPVSISDTEAMAVFSGHWPSGQKSPVTDVPILGVADTSIATYSENKLVGVGEGKTNLTATLYGITRELPYSINVYVENINDISLCNIGLSPSTCTYNGEEQKPEVTVTSGSTTLKENIDYTLTYGDNINVGKAYVDIIGINNWEGSTRKYFTIIDAVTTVHIPVKYEQTKARALLNDINEMSTTNDLIYDYDLEQVAMQRAAELALSFTITRPNGTSWKTAYGDMSWTGIASYYASSSSGDAIVKWASQDSIAKSFECIGIGHVYYNGYHFWDVEVANRDSINNTATPVNDSEQTVAVEVLQSSITDLDITLEQEKYDLQVNETVAVPTPKVMTTFSDSWPSGKKPVADTPIIDVEDTSIATYSENKLVGVSEGTTNLTAKLYGYTKVLPYPVNVSTKKNISSCKISLSEENYVYDGEEKKPEVTVTSDSTVLRENTDYTITYGDNINAGKAYVEIKGINQWTGSIYEYFTIKGKNISDLERSLGATCNGTTQEEQNPSLTIKDGTKTLIEGTDYRIRYEVLDKETDKTAWDGVLWITGIGNYNGNGVSIGQYYKYHKYLRSQVIEASTCSKQGIKRWTCNNCGKTKDESIELDPDNHTYDEGVITKKPTCTTNGTKTYTCTGCKTTKTENIEATGHNLTKTEAKSPTYTEVGNKEYYTCKECGKVFSDVEGKNETSISEMTIPVLKHELTKVAEKAATYKEAGNKEYYICKECDKLFLDTAAKQETTIEEVTIAPLEKKAQTIMAVESSYTKTYGDSSFSLGAKAKGKLTYKSSNTSVAIVSSSGKITIKGVGTAKITITAAETSSYKSATKTVTITVHPKSTTLSSVTSGIANMTVKWTKNSDATGYEISYATKSDFSNEKTYLVTNSNTTSKTIGKRTEGKKYYVRIRCYKTVKNENYYSEWSATKTVVILPNAVKLNSITSTAAGKFTAKWSQNENATGYQVQYATKSNFSGGKTVTVASNKTLSKTVTSLSPGTKYYIRVRCYKTVSAQNYYSPWSTAKSIVTLPKTTSLSSVISTAKGKFTAKWTKNSAITGYQIQYATKSNFSNAKTSTITSYKTTSKVITGLTNGKKYYVRIRCYKTVSGVKYYSAWSSAKTVTIKK